MRSRILTALCVFLGLSSVSPAQQNACKTIEVPVGVISATGEAFRGLAAEDFVVRLQKKQIAVKTLTYDEGPRRVLIVVDTNKKLSADSRKAEIEMVQVLLSSARPGDTFGLMAARGAGQDVKFTADHTAITQALSLYGDGKREKEPGVLDVLMVGTEWFGAPQAGDAIVVIAADLEGNRKANARQVARALSDAHIRMFGLALGPVETKNSVATSSVTTASSQGLALAQPVVGEIVYDTGDEHFYPLTSNSGGLVFVPMNGDPRRSYSMTDARVVQQVRQRARSVARMISAYYRMQIEVPQLSHAEDWSLNVNEEIRKHAQQMWVLYPRELGPC